MARAKSSWTCPKCGRRFGNRNQWHSCGTFSVQDHLARAGPKAASLYRQLEAFLSSLGPVDVSPSGTMIAFKNGATFVSAAFRGGGLRIGVIFDHIMDHPRFVGLESVSPRSHAHAFVVAKSEDLDAEAEAMAPRGVRPCEPSPEAMINTRFADFGEYPHKRPWRG